MTWRGWTLIALVVLAIAGAIALVFRGYVEDYRGSMTVLQARTLIAACEAYQGHSSAENKYPSTLNDLVSPPWGGPSLLRNGKDELVDSWGSPFRDAVVPNEKGEVEIYVWAERIVDGKTSLIGAKRTGSGETQHFGL
jgi:hypothetical protein